MKINGFEIELEHGMELVLDADGKILIRWAAQPAQPMFVPCPAPTYPNWGPWHIPRQPQTPGLLPYTGQPPNTMTSGYAGMMESAAAPLQTFNNIARFGDLH